MPGNVRDSGGSQKKFVGKNLKKCEGVSPAEALQNGLPRLSVRGEGEEKRIRKGKTNENAVSRRVSIARVKSAPGGISSEGKDSSEETDYEAKCYFNVKQCARRPQQSQRNSDGGGAWVGNF